MPGWTTVIGARHRLVPLADAELAPPSSGAPGRHLVKLADRAGGQPQAGLHGEAGSFAEPRRGVLEFVTDGSVGWLSTVNNSVCAASALKNGSTKINCFSFLLKKGT